MTIYHRANFNSEPKSRSFKMINIDSRLTNCLMTILKANLMSLINKHSLRKKRAVKRKYFTENLDA